MDERVRAILRKHQLSEITEHHIYLQLAARQRDANNRDVLERIAADEKRHADLWQRHISFLVGFLLRGLGAEG